MKETRFMFAKKTILFIFAHMDDETISSYGTIRKMADAGANVILYCICGAGRMTLSDTYTLKHHNQRTDTFHEFRLSNYIYKSECAYQNTSYPFSLSPYSAITNVPKLSGSWKSSLGIGTQLPQ